MVSGAGGQEPNELRGRIVFLMPAPLLDHGLRFVEGVEDFSAQQFIPEPGIEALAVAVLPRITPTHTRNQFHRQRLAKIGSARAD